MPSGPFGNYDFGTTGYVLNSLCKYGLPVNTVENICVGSGKLTTIRDKPYGSYRLFSVERVILFWFEDTRWLNLITTFDPNREGLLSPIVPMFRANVDKTGQIVIYLDTSVFSDVVVNSMKDTPYPFVDTVVELDGEAVVNAKFKKINFQSWNEAISLIGKMNTAVYKR